MGNNIFLGEFDSKRSVSTNSGLNVKLGGKRKLLPSNDTSYIISSYDQYVEERDYCNRIRLTCQVNPVCSNVLFNRVSEIVKDEGSSGVTFVNYGIYENENDKKDEYDYVVKDVIHKTPMMYFWSGNSATYQANDEMVDMLSYETPIKIASESASESYSTVCFGSPLTTDGRIPLHPTNSIRDMQLSRIDDEGNYFVYHCGLDILNNHLIRSKTFRPICPIFKSENVTDDSINSLCETVDGITNNYGGFNTIADVMRDVDGKKVVEKIYFPVAANVDGNTKILTRHVYEYDDICTFEEAVETRLIDKYNGWLGFINKSKIKSYKNFGTSNSMNIERPIMYMNGGDFVDMYPSRDLYTFVPKWNKFKKRIEKNWNYCITYPSSSTTKGFDDIIERNNNINSLKAIYFDDNTRADNGTSQIVIYSIAKHGLAVGDFVNIYKTYEVSGDTSLETVTEKIIDNAEVASIADDYIFTVFGGGVKISDSWVELSDEDMANGYLSSSAETYILDSKTNKYFVNEADTTKRYYIVNSREGYNGYVSLDDTALNISYKKVVGDVECEYYVRIFSKLPNFKFASGTTTEYDLYRSGSTMIQTYNKKKYEFENHVSRLAFAKNIYSDDVGEVVFTDDIDISNLKDNLGRPLSSIYLTIIKNNKGYKEWYGFVKNDVDWYPNWIRERSDDIEFSHCFGKVTCGFYLSDESIYAHANSIKKMSHANDLERGYNCVRINEDRNDELGKLYDSGMVESFDDCEIWYDTDSNFYGDLCYYDAFNAVERVVQPIMHRFNTAQRESIKAKSTKYFDSFIYDNIQYDDYDSGSKYRISSKLADGCNDKKEGYYYIPHYEIPIKTFDMVNTVLPDFLTIRSLVNMPDGCKITVLENHYLGVGDKAMICDEANNKYYYCLTTSSINDKVFICDIYDENGNKSDNIPDLFSSSDNIDDYKLFKTDNLDIPSYANLIKDGSCRFIWRNIVNNGMNPNDKTIEEYPFTNGAFYVNKRVDLYLRRQDPVARYQLYSDDDLEGRELEIEKEDNYVKDDEITC